MEDQAQGEQNQERSVIPVNESDEKPDDSHLDNSKVNFNPHCIENGKKEDEENQHETDDSVNIKEEADDDDNANQTLHICEPDREVDNMSEHLSGSKALDSTTVKDEASVKDVSSSSSVNEQRNREQCVSNPPKPDIQESQDGASQNKSEPPLKSKKKTSPKKLDPYSFSSMGEEKPSTKKVSPKKPKENNGASKTKTKRERPPKASEDAQSKPAKKSSPKANRRGSSSTNSTSSLISFNDSHDLATAKDPLHDHLMKEDFSEDEDKVDRKITSPESEDDENRLIIAEDESEPKKKSKCKAEPKDGEAPKPRRKHNRFNGMSEEEIAKRLLPDVLAQDLDILIIGINPGMYAAYKGHHYAGPGNHFWKCLFLSGLIPRPMTAEDDVKCLDHGIGFTNIVERTTRGSANLSKKEIIDGTQALIDKIKEYKPKIAVFNGKGIYEVFRANKEFHLGKQPEPIDGTNTFVWVMPNSSARCAQLPRAVDKVPFYSALKKFRDYLTGALSELNDDEIVFKDVKLKNFNESTQKKLERAGLLNTAGSSDEGGGHLAKMNSEFKVFSSDSGGSSDLPSALDIRIDPQTGKKRRGRPPKPRPDGSLPPPKRRAVDSSGNPIPRGSNPIDPLTGKKKRGRPKKTDLPPGTVYTASKKSKKRDVLEDHGLDIGENSSDSKLTGSDSLSLTGVSTNSHSTSSLLASTPLSMANKPTKIVPPLPPFSPNFSCSDLSEVDEKPVDLKKPFFDPQGALDGNIINDRLNQGPQSTGLCVSNSQDFSRSSDLDPESAALASNHPATHPSPNSDRYPPSGAGNYHYPPSESAVGPVQSNNPHAGSYAPYEVTPPHQNNHSVSSNGSNTKSDDVTTKSITGLESLVEQIPAIAAENDSGVFSGTSGAGSHPNTPRSPTSGGVGVAASVGGGGGGGGGGVSGSFPNYNVPSTSDLGSESTNYSQLPSAIAANSSSASSAPTDFSVNSLVYSNSNATSSNADPFSVSSLTSTPSHHHHAQAAADMMMSKYHGLPTGPSNPYAAAAGMFPSSSSFGAPAGFLGGAGNSFSANPMQAAMGHMGMSYYGQYPNAYGAAHHGFAASPYSHGLHMPNPSYPYPSPYGQSPYSQSPYF
ncbi:hypothetical protein TCAL_07535 [Tigriopus californicus]|uniref:G/T mismatch-specific thymine DNA glycosylase n=1 Tax=Tigriopus californicus TaxID=6832 RepID=A0A553NXT7_TIGCA|nr:hypothetical protein TCAL_07535 [Tigriopus californicus]